MSESTLGIGIIGVNPVRGINGNAFLR